jgi:acyl-CoA thioester hydrolase
MHMLYVHEIKVRYSEVDSQGIVFNAHYLTYCDDTFESWFRACFADRLESLGVEIVVKRAIIEWHTAARLAAVIELGIRVERVGLTSFEFKFEGCIQGTRAFVAQLTYVVVDRRTFKPVEIPDRLRSVLAGDSGQPPPRATNRFDDLD